MSATDKQQEVSGSVKAPGWLLSGLVMGALGTATTWGVLGSKDAPDPKPTPAIDQDAVRREATLVARAAVDESERKAEVIRAQHRQELLQTLTTINAKLDDAARRDAEVSTSLAEIRGRLKLPVR